ncbi:MAG: hypothetical protein IPK22_13510 [Verrucomicrobiaceae bacterium]|nr:hypothetical protein [Verrucomicrobiaceae bacterium]
MNLVLHHFGKEFRYLRWRWMAWLGVLILQLAADAEWIAPMQAAGASPAWVGLLPLLMWGGAMVLALSYSKEDALADDRSFIAVRPLPRASYAWSRVLVFLLLIALPLVLQEGVYLGVSGLRTADVLLGMWERFFITIAVIGGLWPMPWLAAGWARYSITAVAFLTGLLAQAMSKKMLQSAWSLYPEMFYNSNSLAQAAWIGAVLMLLLAMWQKGRGWSLARLLTSVAVLTLGCFALVWTPLITPWSWKPREPAEMAKLEANHPVLPPPSTFRFYRSHDEDGKPVLDFDAELASLPAPAELLPRWRMVSGEMRLNEQVIPAKVHGYFSRRFFWMPAVFSRDNAWLMGTLGRSMPSSTLSMDAYDNQHGRNADCSWPILTAGTSLVDVDLRLEADWLRQTVLGECELKPGAKIRTPDAALEVLEVRLHQGANGAREKGSVAVIYKGAKRSIECGGAPFEYMTDLGVMLHAPSKELLWQKRMVQAMSITVRCRVAGRNLGSPSFSKRSSAEVPASRRQMCHRCASCCARRRMRGPAGIVRL